MFFLHDEDRALVDRRRGTHLRVGLVLEPVTMRWLATCLEESPDVPGVVPDVVAGRLGGRHVADAWQGRSPGPDLPPSGRP